jgi:hypothetical protein
MINLDNTKKAATTLFRDVEFTMERLVLNGASEQFSHFDETKIYGRLNWHY